MSKFDYHQFSKDLTPTEAGLGGDPREVSESDFAAVRNHLVRLDKDSLYQRFGFSVSDERLAQHVDSMRDRDATIFGCWVLGRIRGVGELRRFGSGPDLRAEAALTVERSFQDLGLGHALMTRMIEEAERYGVREILVGFDFRDRHMRRIVEQAGASLHFEGADCIGRIAIEDRRELAGQRSEPTAPLRC
jgi:GNAT superfamily N-acetyltransferase